ncbi:MAG: DNA polymerase I [Bacteroidia bacterium]|nr:DNA polymerase I [Bacteroidia bacterium]
MSSKKKLFLLDGFALVYRSYFAFINNPRISSSGRNTSTEFGFTNTLLDVIQKQKPTHLAVVFDPREESSERSSVFTGYKANRQEMPEDICNALPYIERIVHAFNIPLLVMEGYEADDVIGTLALMAPKDEFDVYIMSPDKDLSQMVAPGIFWFRPGRMGNPDEVFDEQKVCEKFGVTHPKQVIDLLGLMGDAVDNIPGIPGVGEKTAQKFIQEFGSVEGLLANTHQLKGKMKEKVEAGAEMAILSKQLATVITSVPIEFHEESLQLDPPNEEALKELFAELEFRNMHKRVFGETLTATTSVKPMAGATLSLFDQDNAPTEEALDIVQFASYNPETQQYIHCQTEEQWGELLTELAGQAEFCVDTETTGLDELTAELVGMSISTHKDKGWYISFPEDAEECKKILERLRPFLCGEAYTKIGQNIKYDYSVLLKYGIRLSGPMFDTMLAHYILEPDQRHNMDFLSESYLGYTPISIETLIGKKGKGQLNMRDVEYDKIVPYACEDADVTLQLKQLFAPRLVETATLSCFTDIEMPLMPVLAAMEMEGVKIDTQNLQEYSQLLGTEALSLENEIIELAGMRFNIASPRQLGDVLFEILKLDPKAKKTRTGQYSTNEEVLSKLAGKHPIIDKILSYREVQKLKSTYVDALPALIHPLTGRVHTSFMQAVASTGRLSSQNPNLQNIPIRSEKGREIRKAFIARDEEHILLSADYSQVELRIIAALSGEEHMIEAFRSGMDIHTTTAARLYNISSSEVTREMRSNAKTVNFGIIYGISAFGLAQRVNISRTEAAEIIESYFRSYPRIKTYMNDQIGLAREKGFVSTISGRRRYLRDINSANHTVRGFAERNAINAPIQGSAADIIKMAMIRIGNELDKRGLRSRMVLQVHDELVFDVYRPELEEMQELVRDYMQNAVKLDVPLEVETGTGVNWLDAH